jgi:hypothetical protein
LNRGSQAFSRAIWQSRATVSIAEISRKAAFASTTCPVAAATWTRRGEGGKDSTLDMAKAVADYASS